MIIVGYFVGLVLGLFLGFGLGLTFGAVCIIRGKSRYFQRRPKADT